MSKRSSRPHPTFVPSLRGIDLVKLALRLSFMADSEQSSKTGRFEVKADVPTHFAWLRTRMSIERTLMSWLRTATALIGFGFTIFPVSAKVQPDTWH